WAIEDKSAQFGIAVIDLNFLKRINDTYGHEQGNITIRKLCHIVCTVFKHSPVFRIGGDEFAVILENDDYANAHDLEKQFNAVLEELAGDASLEQWERVSAAIGMAFFDAIKDDSVDNVFKRADKAMYARKKAMKGVREQ
ncbi:MAG: GGDEF domain-containing protein, partial [Desulfovibrio sp.]|nr:GGDEF domain-containing protein [Desulfovibrio sp.]